MLLENKVAIVTGSASGLGKAIAIAYANEGAKVILADINEAGVKETEKQILANGKAAVALKVDVTVNEDLDAMVDEAINRYGKVDILVNSAGISISEPFLESTIEAWDKTFDVNVAGPLFATQKVVKYMKQQGSGSIINLSSHAAFRGRPEQEAYCAAKGTLHVMTRNLALQLAPHGIRVNSLVPGIFENDFDEMACDKTEEQKQDRIDHMPMRRLGKPEDITGAAIFLASEMSAFTTGDALAVDGGMHCHLSGHD